MVANPTADQRRKMPDPDEFLETEETEIPMHSVNTRTCHRASNGSVSSALAWDDLTGMRLDAGQVIEARNKEIDDVQKMMVWKKIPRTVAKARGWKVIQTRWIDINKGDDDGNSADGTHTVTVVDTTDPEITCPPDVEIYVQEGNVQTDGVGAGSSPAAAAFDLASSVSMPHVNLYESGTVAPSAAP